MPDENTAPAPMPAAGPRPRSGIDTHQSRRVDLGKRRRPMLEWLFYVVGLLVLVACVAYPLRGTIKDLNPTIPGIILAIFAFALVKNFLDMRFISREIRLASTQIDELRQTNNIFIFLQGSSPSLFRDHIDNLHEIFRRDCTLSQDNLVTLLQARLLARTKIVDFCSSILVTLGLVGTIIGLIQSTGGLESIFLTMTSGDTSIGAGIKEALGGMGIAFYTTLMGAILGGVCLRLLSSLIDSNVEHIVSHIAELTEIYILPVLRRAARINEEHQRLLRAKGIGLPPGVPVPGTVPATPAPAPSHPGDVTHLHTPPNPNEETMH